MIKQFKKKISDIKCLSKTTDKQIVDKFRTEFTVNDRSYLHIATLFDTIESKMGTVSSESKLSLIRIARRVKISNIIYSPNRAQ